MRRAPIKRVLTSILLLAAVSTTAAGEDVPTDSTTGSGGRDRATVALPSYDTFVDSLQTNAPTLSDTGLEENWAVADSVEALIIEQGPAFADTARSQVFRKWNFDGSPALTTFNRIEGFRFGLQGEVSYGEHSVDGAAAYGFSNEEWRYRARLRLGLGKYGELRAQYVDLIEPYGVAPLSGNGFYAFVAGADDQDYLRRDGWELGLSRALHGIAFYLGYQEVDESSVAVATDWNLFGRNRGPRPNPPIDDGRARRLRIEIDKDWRVWALRSALIRLRIHSDVAGYGFGGDFDYDRHLVEVKSDLRGPWRDDIRLLVQAGGARNGPPAQSLFYLGGPTLLRAFRVHELAGDRLLVASLDYYSGFDYFARLGIPWLELQFVPFAEIGATWFDPNQTGLFSKPVSSDWRSDAGLGIQRNILFGASARADLAFRLDRASERFTWRFRFETPLFDRF